MKLFNLPVHVVIVIVSLMLMQSLRGDVVYDNGLFGAEGVFDGFRSDLDDAFDPNGTITADNFSLTNNETIVAVEWSGIYDTFDTNLQLVDNFTIDIYSDDLGVPGELLSRSQIGNFANRTDSGLTAASGLRVFEYSGSIQPFDAAAGTEYWLNVYANTQGLQYDWFWGQAGAATPVYFSNDLGSSWATRNNTAVDFRLVAVPEPNTFLLAASLFGFTALRRKRGPANGSHK